MVTNQKRAAQGTNGKQPRCNKYPNQELDLQHPGALFASLPSISSSPTPIFMSKIKPDTS